MRFFLRLLLLLAPLFLGGCFFEKPLTSGPSESLNTWFLGEWQRTEKTGGTSRALVTPSGNDMYRVQVTLSEKGVKTEYDFEAWTSKVGDSTFLTLHSLRASSKVPLGAFVFLHPEMRDQNQIRLRPIHLASPKSATSKELRAEIRARLKDGSLFAEEEASDWQRTAEVYWKKDGETGVFKPLRYEKRWQTEDLRGTYRTQQPKHSKSVGLPH
ncbi:MAG: hypothetical protein WCG52_07715 [bacterium]